MGLRPHSHNGVWSNLGSSSVLKALLSLKGTSSITGHIAARIRGHCATLDLTGKGVRSLSRRSDRKKRSTGDSARSRTTAIGVIWNLRPFSILYRVSRKRRS